MIRTSAFAVGFTLLASPAFAFPAVTVAQAGFATGPGTDYDIYGTLPSGTHVDVIWCGTHKDWCLVEVHKIMGWIPADNLQAKGGKNVAFLNGASGGGGSGPVADDPASRAAALDPAPPTIHPPISSIHIIQPVIVIPKP